MTLRAVGLAVTALVFEASLLVHAATFVPEAAIAMEHVWPLHLGAIGSLMMMLGGVGRINADLRKNPPAPGPDGTPVHLRREFSRRVLAATPLPVKVLLGLAMVYVVFNFVTSIPAGGGPAVQDGVYVLQSHGTVTREITLAEYMHFRTLEVRAFSGHWMMFSLVPLVFYTWVWPRSGLSARD